MTTVFLIFVGALIDDHYSVGSAKRRTAVAFWPEAERRMRS